MKSDLLILIAVFLICLTSQSWAYSTIPIHGQVKRYSNGIYHIQTKTASLTVQRSKLFPSHIDALKITGEKINIRIPASAVLSYQKIKRAKPGHSKRRKK